MNGWTLGQANRIAFVMVNAAGTEVAGLGSALVLELSKNDGAFAPGAGTVTEIGNGWYTYLSTAAEADTLGTLSVKVTGAGCVQQNLEYVIEDRNAGAVAWTFTVTSSAGGTPIQGATVYVSTDAAGAQRIANGVTDAAGQVVFMLQPATYYFWTYDAQYAFTNPTVEAVH